MQISIPVDNDGIEIVDHNIVDETKSYDNSDGGAIYETYVNQDDVWQDNDKLYEYAGDTFTPAPWASADESGYVVDEVIFKDGLTQKVTSVGAHYVARQPEDPLYTVTATTNYDNWTERYNKLRTGLTLPFSQFFDMVVGATKHSLYQTAITATYPYGWVYRVSWTTFYNVWSATQYSSTYRIVSTLTTATGAKNITITWNGATIYNASSTYHQIPIGTTFTGTDGVRYKCIEERYHDPAETTDGYTSYTFEPERYEAVPQYFVVGNGTYIELWWNGTAVLSVLAYAFPEAGTIYTVGSDRYKVGAWKEAIDGSAFYSIYKETSTYVPGTTEPYDIYYYSLKQEQQASKTDYKHQSARVTYESSLEVYEEKAYNFSTPSSEMWMGRHFIIRGTDLYVRTQTSDAQLSELVSDNQYQVIEALSEFPNFNENGLVNFLKPLDSTNYTFISQVGAPDPVVYKLKSTVGRFDAVALSNLICDDIELIFYDASDNVVAVLDSYVPKNYRDIAIDDSGIETNVLPPYPTTVVLYSTADNIIPIGGSVQISLTGGVVQLGTIKLGLSASAGFTNLQFTNKFNDWSPREVDQWGNVSYIPGVKTNVFSGTVDVRIEDYDMTTRLMTSIGGSTVIINGSDAKDNQTPDNSGIFASTMLIGRLKDFQLKTKIADADMDVMATYGITVEENT